MVLEYIRRHPDSLINQKLPPMLVSIIRSWLHTPWMVTKHNSTTQHLKLQEPCQQPLPHKKGQGFKLHTPSVHSESTSVSLSSNTGVMQGDPLSTILFTLTFRMTLDFTTDHLFQKDPSHAMQFVTLPVPESRLLTPERRPVIPLGVDLPKTTHPHSLGALGLHHYVLQKVWLDDQY
eukprot:3475862-Amphidinium_carterae.2